MQQVHTARNQTSSSSVEIIQSVPTLMCEMSQCQWHQDPGYLEDDCGHGPQCHLGLWETLINISHNFLDQIIYHIIKKIIDRLINNENSWFCSPTSTCCDHVYRELNSVNLTSQILSKSREMDTNVNVDKLSANVWMEVNDKQADWWRHFVLW